MACAILAVLWAGLSGASGPWLWLAGALAAAEAVVFVASGMKCPLTGLASRYGMPPGGADTWLPERLTRHTLAVFGPLLALGVGLLALRTLRGG
ncbi:MAG: hypothetical protein EON95_13135 [Caulobacteraceae bacterium]|nr:MAG: hypothetical protein EON95_13135 [Caulobacteraceae bacterium]